MAALARIVRLLQICLGLYLTAALLYTTNYVVVSPLRLCYAFFSPSQESPRPTTATRLSWLEFPRLPGASFVPSPAATMQDVWMPQMSKAGISWTPSSGNNTVSMAEETFLSKAFAQSMKPSKIVPFFYRATGMIDEDDVTLTTLVTSNRFSVLKQLVKRYRGPISVTIHVHNTTAELAELLTALHSLYISTPHMTTYVDVHLVIDAFDRQFNTWRNAARLFARTRWVMMLDVDFAVCTDFRAAVRASAEARHVMADGEGALVIPAFEYVKKKEGSDQRTFPTDKKSLIALVEEGRVGMFHSSWALGHNSTDYPRYYTTQPGEVYKVTQYQSAYEPYVIFKKDGPPWCDERFVGYGGNKAACLFEMYISGMSFYVLGDHFLVHQNHAYEEAARKLERKSNRKIYADFKEETCLRYLKRYYNAGLLNTTKGHNLQEECKKIKGVSRVAAQLIEG